MQMAQVVDAGTKCAHQPGQRAVCEPQPAGSSHSALPDAEHSEPLHIQLAEWGDVLLFAPLSANTMGKLALGLCDNLVSRMFRAWDIRTKPVLAAPAMNTKMWQHAATTQHLGALQALGVCVLPPVSKTLACGEVGVGAMAAVADIARAVLEHRHPHVATHAPQDAS
jgi:phosphopantothenoylcysteine synthetase/decarboxylase